MNKLVPIGPSAAAAVIAALFVGCGFMMLLAGASYSRGAPAQSSPTYISAIQVDPKRPTVVYAVDHGVLKSTDGGQTWSAASKGLTAPPETAPPGLAALRVDALALDARSPNVLYAGTGLGVFKTSDGARTWRLAGTGIDYDDDSVKHRLYEGSIWALAIDALHTSTVYAAGRGGVWKTTTGGATWKHVLRYRVISVAIDPRRPRTVYGSGMKRWPRSTPRSSIYKTVDGGGTWHASGPPGLLDSSYVVVERHRAGVVYAGGSRGLFASANQGRTWNRLLSASALGRVDAIALDPSRANVLYVGTWGHGVFKSNDGGQTWSALRLDTRNVSVIEIAPTRPQTIYVGGEGIWKSTDGGATWHRVTR